MREAEGRGLREARLLDDRVLVLPLLALDLEHEPAPLPRLARVRHAGLLLALLEEPSSLDRQLGLLDLGLLVRLDRRLEAEGGGARWGEGGAGVSTWREGCEHAAWGGVRARGVGRGGAREPGGGRRRAWRQWTLSVERSCRISDWPKARMRSTVLSVVSRRMPHL